ncbi:MAG TPA: hypothetical protein VGP68_17145 [Gemmataceae bacterium]|jgi:hypothetical protein|nr:hypothetical protein [Gemmataceae bacterium]
MADKVTEVLLDVLKQALTESGEHRLFRTGKLDGLFASHTALNNDAADLALRDGLLEVVRTETKGKATTQWVRSTTKAVEFIHQHESPLQTLQELQAILQTSRDGLPLWLDDMRQRLNRLGDELVGEAQKWTQRLEALHRQVGEALEKARPMVRQLKSGDEDGQWAQESLGYLERRKATGAAGDCSFPELFSALQAVRRDLSITGFHDQLLRLQDRRALRLLPFPGEPSAIPEPEYALPDGTQLLYYVAEHAN